jgi:hypothetical protein
VPETDHDRIRHEALPRSGPASLDPLLERIGDAVAVQDASTVPPRPPSLDVTRPGGFGWHLVQDLSVEVGVDSHAAGKTVTAVVPCATGVAPQRV